MVGSIGLMLYFLNVLVMVLMVYGCGLMILVL